MSLISTPTLNAKCKEGACYEYRRNISMFKHLECLLLSVFTQFVRAFPSVTSFETHVGQK